MKDTLPATLTRKLFQALVDYWLNVYDEVDDEELALCETVEHELLGQVWWAAFRRLATDDERLYHAIIRMDEFQIETWIKDSFTAVRAECLAIEKARANGRLLSWDVSLTLRVWGSEVAGRNGNVETAEGRHQITVEADGPKAAVEIATNAVLARLGIKKDPQKIGIYETVRLGTPQSPASVEAEIIQRPLSQAEATSVGSDAYYMGGFGASGCVGYMLTYGPDIGQLTYETNKDGAGASILSIEVAPSHRRRGVARALVRRLCELHRGRITPGTIVTPHAAALIRMIKEEATRAGCAVGEYRLDPCPESDESAGDTHPAAAKN